MRLVTLRDAVVDLPRGAKQLLIVSPWVKFGPVRLLCKHLPQEIDITVLTRGLLEDFVSGASDLEAFEFLLAMRARVFIANNLHAKAYSNGRVLVVGSANFTDAGSLKNTELLIEISAPDFVAHVVARLSEWVLSARPVDASWLAAMKAELHRRLPECEDDALAVRPRALALEGPELPSDGLSFAVDELPLSPASTQGKYRDLPMPAEWEAIVQRLRPGNPPHLNPLSISTFASVIHTEVTALDARLAEVVLRRCVEGQTLEHVGREFGVVRERIRQLEVKAFESILNRSPGLKDQLVKWLDAPEGFFCRACEVVDPVAVEVAVAIAGWVLKRDTRVLRAMDAMLIYDHRNLPKARQELRRQMRTPMLQNLDDLADQIGMSPDEVGVLVRVLSDEFYSVADGRISAWFWTKTQKVALVAKELAKAGFTEWHGSELCKAMRAFDPTDFGSYDTHDLLALLSRPAKPSVFEFAGRAGVWRLCEYGDGHSSSQEAVEAILRASAYPLHTSDLARALKRNVGYGTLVQILDRELFVRFGSGVYGLAGESYVVDDKIETWLISQIDAGLRQAAQLEEASVGAGVPSAAIRGTAAVSKKLRLKSTRHGALIERS